MKVLVATRFGQGHKRYDICTTLEGELVALHHCADTCYVCRRVLIGLASSGETSTFMVVDRTEIDREMYRTFVRDGMARIGHKSEDPSDEAWLDDLVDSMIELAAQFPCGVVIERDDHEFRVRLDTETAPGPTA